MQRKKEQKNTKINLKNNKKKKDGRIGNTSSYKTKL